MKIAWKIVKCSVEKKTLWLTSSIWHFTQFPIFFQWPDKLDWKRLSSECLQRRKEDNEDVADDSTQTARGVENSFPLWEMGCRPATFFFDRTSFRVGRKMISMTYDNTLLFCKQFLQPLWNWWQMQPRLSYDLDEEEIYIILQNILNFFIGDFFLCNYFHAPKKYLAPRPASRADSDTYSMKIKCAPKMKKRKKEAADSFSAVYCYVQTSLTKGKIINDVSQFPEN